MAGASVAGTILPLTHLPLYWARFGPTLAVHFLSTLGFLVIVHRGGQVSV